MKKWGKTKMTNSYSFIKTTFVAGIALGIFSFTWGASGYCAIGFDISTLPDGLPVIDRPAGPAAIGVLDSSIFGSQESRLQRALSRLENKIYGMAMLGPITDSERAEKAYYLEKLSLGLINEVANLNSQSDQQIYENEVLTFKALEVYERARFWGEQSFEVMIRRIDAALPGTSGIQLPNSLATGLTVYSPNYRFEHPLTEVEKKENYAAKLAEFEKSGGNLDSEVKTLTRENLLKLPRVALVEFVAMPDVKNKKVGEIRFTSGSAGHILMAKGEAVVSAGVALIIRDKFDAIRNIILSNSSGSYKPDLSTLTQVSEVFENELGVDRSSIRLTRGEPATAQTVKLLMKSQGINKDQIKEKIKEMEATGNELFAGALQILAPNYALVLPPKLPVTNSKDRLLGSFSQLTCNFILEPK